MNHGKHEEALREWAQEGREISLLESKPKLEPHLQDWFDDFFILHGGRAVGMGPSGISTTCIIAYGREVCGYARGCWALEHFVRTMRVLDATFLDYMAKKK